MIIRTKSFPRAGLIGNPSDGYFGKTIAFTFTNFSAQVTLYETPELEILPATRDHSRFSSIGGLAQDVRQYGYYGGIRLLKAAVKRFHEYAQSQGLALHDRNFTLRYQSNIPHQVGLAGSSAIITACMRALMAFYGVTIPRHVLASLVLSVEVEELSISAGLQDRVAQAYGGLVYMDFERTRMEKHGYGRYERLNIRSLPPLYIAYRNELAEGSDVFHNDVRQRFKRGDPGVLAAMKAWADMTVEVRDLLNQGASSEALGAVMNRNFDLRASLYPISPGNRELIRAARSVGASAKFTGSGGAIIGTLPDDACLARLRKAMAPLPAAVFVPEIAPEEEDDA